MKQVFRLLRFVRPYWKKSLLSLALLIVVVLMDLAIPRLVQRIIDQGITPHDMKVVTKTFLLMLGISILDTMFAIGNNNYSVQVGEGVARDLREALFLKIQSFSFGNLDRLKTGQLMVRLSSDSSVIQRVFQISLRIGTRAPLIMIGSIILMFNTDPHLALTMLPLLLVTSADHRLLRRQDGTAVPDHSAETGQAQHRPAGEHCRCAGGQGVRARPPRRRTLRGGQ